MDQETYNELLDKVWEETNNRSEGAFLRGLWFGHRRARLIIPQGLRPTAKKLPITIATAGLSHFGGPVIGKAAEQGAALIARFLKASQQEIEESVKKAMEKLVELAPEKLKELYSSHVEPRLRRPPKSAEEGLRRNLKKEFKELQEKTIVVIDRNLVKLKHAMSKTTPAAKAMIAAQSLPFETQAARAHDAMRKLAETQYYINKVFGLLYETEEGLGRIRHQLALLAQEFDGCSYLLEKYIVECMEPPSNA